MLSGSKPVAVAAPPVPVAAPPAVKNHDYYTTVYVHTIVSCSKIHQIKKYWSLTRERCTKMDQGLVCCLTAISIIVMNSITILKNQDY